jgi:hypothetical protein
VNVCEATSVALARGVTERVRVTEGHRVAVSLGVAVGGIVEIEPVSAREGPTVRHKTERQMKASSG